MRGVLQGSGRGVACVVLAALAVLAGCAAGDGGGPARNAEEVAGDLARLAIELGSLDNMLDRGADLAWESSLDTLRLEIGREPIYGAANEELMKEMAAGYFEEAEGTDDTQPE